MPANNLRRRRLAAVLALTAAVASCSKPTVTNGEHDTTDTAVPAGATSQPMPPLPAPWNTLRGNNEPTDLITAVIQAVFDWHPERGDTSPEDAARRAVPILTPQAASDYRPHEIPRVTWQSWMDTGTNITPTTSVSTEQSPTDTPVQWQCKATTALTIATPGRLPASLEVTSLITAQKQTQWTITNLADLP